ncbi:MULTISPECIES: O-antigen ligase family protein [unclassified Aminobacter]|uniref:O-antigen ligase family protein n=1 Tax=unclassified Aminobacter TaxID=2644704 RepID=UPI0004674043|nr:MULTISPECIES: O-antigen ligase family protein [unclassified Aminobacter]TWG67515.1 O-antigen ligase-like membrane protein [Aminobacter sp. J44]TWH35621.1 O-antigen ligase-like membrane protein [Aminobacter sp. J15]
MSTVTESGLPREVVQAKAISIITSAAVTFGVFLGGFVLFEPAPYELYMAGLIAVWALFGLRISKYAAILLTLLVLFNVGGLISMGVMGDLYQTPLYLAVSLFLAFTAVFFVAIVEGDHTRYRLIVLGWVAAALVTGTLGIAGYFHLFPGADKFTLYDRASGAFADPNVFGPFLVLPAIWLFHRLLTGNPLLLPVTAGAFVLIVAAIFFSFSRGAWGLFAMSAVLLMIALFLRSQSSLFRLRLALMAVLAISILVAAILVALQLPGVADFFAMRARLVQEYDGGHLGRFARFGIGFRMAMEHPLGIGPLNFGRMLGEDTHNIWLKTLMDYGWLGFASFLTMVLWTIVGGFRILFRERPWQPYLLCAYVVFLGHLGLGTVIDMDHWRHFYLLIGLIWGAMALEQRYQHRMLAR